VVGFPMVFGSAWYEGWVGHVYTLTTGHMRKMKPVKQSTTTALHSDAQRSGHLHHASRVRLI
jgi:hypothetical protein